MRNPNRREALGVLAAAAIWPGAIRAGTLETVTGQAFGTAWGLSGPTGNGMAVLKPDVMKLFGEIDAELSPWRDDSTISRFNAAQSGAMPVGKEFARVAHAALDLAAESGGAFDPTVGPLVAHWGFGPILGDERPNWRGIMHGQGVLGKSQPTLTLDLCGIAKGRALDRATAIASDAGFDSLLLDLGGELSAIGRHPDSRDWQVGVEHPVSAQQHAATLHLPGGYAVATSGLGHNSYALNGRVWGHIIDPLTASPVHGALRSVTVLAADAMTADGWATALFACRDGDGPALARLRDIPALFLYVEDGTIRREMTGGIGNVLS